MNVKYIIGIVIIVGFLIVGGTAFLSSTVQYVPFDEALSAHSTVQVMGKIDFDRVVYDREAGRLAMEIYDAEAKDPAAAQRMEAVYYGVVPGNFEQATSVVLVGQADTTGTFVAEQMLIKCPSKYQGEDGEYQDGARHDKAQAST